MRIIGLFVCGGSFVLMGTMVPGMAGVALCVFGCVLIVASLWDRGEIND